MVYVDLLKKIFELIYDPKMDTVETIEKFFHRGYEQFFEILR